MLYFHKRQHNVLMRAICCVLIAIHLISMNVAWSQSPPIIATTNPNYKDTDGDGYLDGPDTWIDYGPSIGLKLMAGEDKNGNGKYEPKGEDEILGTDDDEYDPNNPNSHPEGDTVLSLDSDRDGLSDEDEWGWGSDPNDADTDDDGIKDSDEVYGTMPCIKGWAVRKLHPCIPDMDGDGLPDGLELGLTQGDQYASEEYPGRNAYNKDWYDDINRNRQYTVAFYNEDPISPPTELQYTFVPVTGQCTITDAFSFDTDHDGIIDSYEDSNKNGLFEPALGETDPSRGLVNLPVIIEKDYDIEDPSWLTFDGNRSLYLNIDLKDGIQDPTIYSKFGVSLGASNDEITLDVDETAIELSDYAVNVSDLDPDYGCSVIHLSSTVSSYIPFQLSFSVESGQTSEVSNSLSFTAMSSIEDIYYNNPDVPVFVIDNTEEQLLKYVTTEIAAELMGVVAGKAIDILPGTLVLKYSVFALAYELYFVLHHIPKGFGIYICTAQALRSAGIRVPEVMLPISGAAVNLGEEAYPALMEIMSLIYEQENMDIFFGKINAIYIYHNVPLGIDPVLKSFQYTFTDNKLTEIEFMSMLVNGQIRGAPKVNVAYMLTNNSGHGLDLLCFGEDNKRIDVELKSGRGKLAVDTNGIIQGTMEYELTRLARWIKSGTIVIASNGRSAIFDKSDTDDKLLYLKNISKDEIWQKYVQLLWDYVLDHPSTDVQKIEVSLFANYVKDHTDEEKAISILTMLVETVQLVLNNSTNKSKINPRNFNIAEAALRAEQSAVQSVMKTITAAVVDEVEKIDLYTVKIIAKESLERVVH